MYALGETGGRAYNSDDDIDVGKMTLNQCLTNTDIRQQNTQTK